MRPVVAWNPATQRLECPSHGDVDLTTARIIAPKTEVIDARSSINDEAPLSADWSEVDALCGRLSALLDINDPRIEVEVYRRDRAKLRASDKRRLVHNPNCNTIIALNNPGWMGNRNCDCQPEWK